MTNILKFPDLSDELKETSYSGGEGRDLGVITKCKRLEIIKLSKNTFLVVTPEGQQVCERKALAEFLWVAAIFMDSEHKWHPNVDLVGCDY